MQKLAITITADVQPLLDALHLLSEFPLEIIERFINAVQTGSEPACVDVNCLPASGTGYLRIVFQPSNFLLEFMAAARARESDGLIRKKVSFVKGVSYSTPGDVRAPRKRRMGSMGK